MILWNGLPRQAHRKDVVWLECIFSVDTPLVETQHKPYWYALQNMCYEQVLFSDSVEALIFPSIQHLSSRLGF